MEELEELGLTSNESKTYETLVKFGKLSAGEVSGKSGVPYGRIYQVLESLIEKGFVELIPGQSKKFIASDPETLKEIIERKKENLNQTLSKIEELKKFYAIKEKNPVSVAIGKKGFYKIVEEVKETEKYAFHIKWNAEVKNEWTESRKKKVKQGMDIRDLARYDSETEKNVHEWLKVDKKIRKMNNEGVAMTIKDDEEVMIGLIKSNVTLLIKDKPFTKIMKKMFEETYKNAEEIK